jgi:hypothetical protein
MCLRYLLIVSLCAFRVSAQEKAEPSAAMTQILERLNTLEKDNRELIQQVRLLREEVAARSSNPPVNQPPADNAALDERLTIQENRTAEQAQTKVEAEHKLPVQLTGALLFNAFANSASRGALDNASYGLLSGPNRSGATVRQTLLGLRFQGPELPGGGRINGDLTMDFWAGPPNPSASWLRIRRAEIGFEWKNRSFFVGQDKPLISPYQPDSFAEVGIPPLAGAGNLWLWLPQVRYEERIALGQNSGLTAQVAVLQTQERYTASTNSYPASLEPARPALEGRIAFWHKFDDTRKFEIAPGFHFSSTHVVAQSVGSHLASLDWLVTPGSRFEWKGTLFRGQNAAGLGTLGNGFTIDYDGVAHPIEISGGWSQAAFFITPRLTFNLFGGIENNHPLSAANPGTAARNFTYASNIMYRFGPNVVVSLEALQLRSHLFSGAAEVHNHYDVAFGYLF